MSLLYYIKENPYIRFGYSCYEIDSGIAKKYGIIDSQSYEESRDEFFNRIGVSPNENEYGYNENFDSGINSDDEDELNKIFELGYALDRFVCGSWLARVCAAEHGYCLNKLVNDKNNFVRVTVAEQGYGLDILVNDTNESVLITVAGMGYGLNKLINHKSAVVRKAVAEHGYGLDKLINDTSPIVRDVVARRGYGLDILVNDKNSYVRAEVASKGYGLNILINDESEFVRYCVAEQGYKLKHFLENENSKNVLQAAIIKMNKLGEFYWISPNEKILKLSSDTMNLYFKAMLRYCSFTTKNDIDNFENISKIAIKDRGYNQTFFDIIEEIKAKLKE